MPLSRKLKKRLPLLIILFVFLTACIVFLLQPPVLIVTDASFLQLYGSLRFRVSQARVSLELFRMVRPVQVAESAGADIAALIVESASKAPGAVLFPYRYQEAARFYREKKQIDAVMHTKNLVIPSRLQTIDGNDMDAVISCVKRAPSRNYT